MKAAGSHIWLFHGVGSQFASGAFSDIALAIEWIKRHGLTGTLTQYPIDIGIYDWVIEQGLFKPKYPSQSSAEFIGRFSSAYLKHEHFENGEQLT